jgi:GT2 family glycosyltransferase
MAKTTLTEPQPEGSLERLSTATGTWAQLAAEFLRGSGLEIGAMQSRLRVPPGVAVTQVDRAGIDDDERLQAFAAESVDFIVASHVLERTLHPIDVIATHLVKLRPGGILFYAVSDQFHASTQADLLDLLLDCQERLDSFEIEAFVRCPMENIAVLRKHRDSTTRQVGGETVPLAVAPAPEPRDDAPRAADGALRLSALRMILDEGSVAASWPVGVEGIEGRAMAQPTGAHVSFALRLGGPVTFSAEVRLGEHDWRDLWGAVCPWVNVVDGDGATVRLWSGVLRCAGDGGLPAGLAVICELPASTRTLVFGCDRLPPRRGSPVGRVFWVEPKLLDRSSPPMLPVLDYESPGATAGAPPSSASNAEGTMFSVLTPVHDPPPWMLEQAIASVFAQSLSDWELCLVDDGSSSPEVIAALQRRAATDARVRLLRRDTAGGIASATNAALEMATGRYVAMLDHDDTLEPDALEQVARAIASDPGVEMLYSDEDIFHQGRRIWSHLKPDWSPETICTSGYTCHLAVYRRSLMLELGGFRSGFDGSQDYDFVLRASERVDHVTHIPHVLYRWRAHAGSTAGGDSKGYAFDAARRAVAEHLSRTGRPAEVQFGPAGLYRVEPKLDQATTAALIVPLAGDLASVAKLERAAQSWPSQSHPGWSVVLAGAGGVIEASAVALAQAGIDANRIRTVITADTADHASCLAAGAESTDAEHLVLTLGPVTGLSHDWLARLLGYAADPGVAAAGPLVVAFDGRISDSGVAMVGGVPVFLMHAEDASVAGPFGFGTAVFNVTAVGEALATRRALFQELGGLRAELGAVTLVDYCLRAADAGLRTVTVADSRVRSDDAADRTNDLPAIWSLAAQHPARTLDPYYNPGFRYDRGDFVTRF